MSECNEENLLLKAEYNTLYCIDQLTTTDWVLGRMDNGYSLTTACGRGFWE